MSGDQILNNFENYLLTNENKSENTIANYISDLKGFFKYLLQQKNISEVNTKVLNQVDFPYLVNFIAALHKKGNSAATRSRKISTLKTFFKYLYDMGIIDSNPAEKLKKPKLPKRNPVFLDIEEVEKLFSIIDDVRDEAIFETFLNTGLRLDELVKIELSDFKTNTLNIIRKGDEEQCIPLNDKCIVAIHKYLIIRPNCDSKYLFLTNRLDKFSKSGIEKMFNKYRDAAGLPKKITIHKLRHTFASLLVQNGATLKSIQELLGHNDIKTTTIYANLNQEHLRNTVDILNNLR